VQERFVRRRKLIIEHNEWTEEAGSREITEDYCYKGSIK
jgi:hypothetical protein